MPLFIVCRSALYQQKLARLAKEQKIEVLEGIPNLTGYSLVGDDAGLSLVSNTADHGAIRVDFAGGGLDYRRKFGGCELIRKAVGLKAGYRPHVIDLTAGLGRDAFILAVSGCELTLVERHWLIHALLEDALIRGKRKAQDDDLQLAEILSRMSLRYEDANTTLEGLQPSSADVIYLDPMFPERKKNSAVKKEMQAFQTIVEKDMESGLLQKAVKKAKKRVVVKRPKSASFLNEKKASFSISNKTLRFDIYLT